MGCPTFTSKTASFPSTISTHLIHPFLYRPHSPPKRYPDPISIFSKIHPPTIRQTDRLRDLPTNGICSIYCWSDAAKIISELKSCVIILRLNTVLTYSIQYCSFTTLSTSSYKIKHSELNLNAVSRQSYGRTGNSMRITSSFEVK